MQADFTSIHFLGPLQMALELNRILEDRIDERTGQPAKPAYCEPGGFLKGVVKPLYTVVSGVSGLREMKAMTELLQLLLSFLEECSLT